MKTTRRSFLISSAGVVSAVALSRQALAAEHVDENSALAKQLGYKHDASMVDAKAQPKFKPGEHCANCQLYQGKPGDPWGPCPIFSGQDVAEKGWCSAYTPKA
ncbi:MAG: High potential iron-sulfur protein [Castellaniella sp.]|uniref:high-potential iron-sulfur protein n=1 Tax=Castellaniella sp. TaxID=1955812 RepID=UPI001202D72D|nr:high-potential iron-sulfur protein [Castellaniella sp.]TAN27342.1 MAG: High potential iron-sulfur protein [Castellaniella sp.]